MLNSFLRSFPFLISPPTVSVEFGRAVWLRFYPPAFPPCPNPSFVAHLGGVLVGLTLGVVVLQNYEQRLQEQSLFWIFFCVYTLFVLCAVFWNIFAYSLLDVRMPPLPWVGFWRQLRQNSVLVLARMGICSTFWGLCHVFNLIVWETHLTTNFLSPVSTPYVICFMYSYLHTSTILNWCIYLVLARHLLIPAFFKPIFLHFFWLYEFNQLTVLSPKHKS